MFEDTLGLLVVMIDRYGLVVLLVVFVLEGALIGKVIPTRTLFVAVLLAAGTGVFDYATVFAAAVIGATAGQSLLFALIRRWGVDPAASPRLPIEDSHVERADRWLDNWGPPAIVFSNVLPVARGSMTVPTAMGDVSGYKFSAYSLVGSAIYTGVLVALADGLTWLGTVGLERVLAVVALGLV